VFIGLLTIFYIGISVKSHIGATLASSGAGIVLEAFYGNKAVRYFFLISEAHFILQLNQVATCSYDI